jgi:acyl transferase domain-containing protein
LNFKTPNEKIHLDEWNIKVRDPALSYAYLIVSKVPQKLQAWPENQVCRASVNSFGYGGTNAHVILEAAEDYFMSNPEVYIQGVGTTGYSSRKSSKSTTASSPRSTTEEWVRIGATRPLELREKYSSAEKQQIFVLTHDNEDGIARLAADLKRYVQQNSPSDRTMLDSLAYTLSSRRSRFEFRVAVGASSTETLIDSLDKVAKGSTRSKKSLKSPKICFAFTGE